MRTRAMNPALTLTLLYAVQANAQTPGAVNSPNTPVRQIDRAEGRVTRVELHPGGRSLQ